MALNILERGKTFGDFLGEGLGEGVKFFGEQNVKRMERNAFAKRLKASGMDENYAYMPEKFGLAALKNKYTQDTEQRAENKATSQAVSSFNSRIKTYLDLNGDPKHIQGFVDEGPVAGLKTLDSRIKSLEKPATAMGRLEKEGLRDRTGVSPYKKPVNNSDTPLYDQAHGVVDPDLKYFQDLLKATEPTQAEKQQKKQDAYNVELQKERQANPPKNQNDIINDKAAENLINQGQQPAQKTDPKLDWYREQLSDPNVPIAHKLVISEEMKEHIGSNALQKASSFGIGALQGFASMSLPFLPATIASGALGLTKLGTDFAYGKNESEESYIPSYEELQQKSAQRPKKEPESFMGKVGHRLMKDLFGEPISNALGINPPLPPTAGQVSDILKEQTKGTALEKYAIPQSSGQRIAEEIGELFSYGFKPTSSLTGNAKEAAKALTKAVGSKGVGWLTERYTGSKLAGALATNGIFLASNLIPGTFRSLSAKRAVQYEENVIAQAEKAGKKVDFEPYLEKLDRIHRDIQKMPLESAERTVLEAAQKQMQELADPKGLIDPQSLMNTSKIQSQNITKAPKEAQKLLTEMVEVQEQALTDLGKKVNREYANAFKESNELSRTAATNEATRQAIIDKLPMRQLSLGTILSYIGGWPIALGAAGLAYGGATLKNTITSAAMRAAFGQSLKANAAGNVAMFDKSVKQFDKAFKKAQPELYYKIDSHRDEFLSKIQNLNIFSP